MINDIKTIIPHKLQPGDEIRVVAPARSLSLINKETRDIAVDNFNKLGLKVTFSDNCEESDQFLSSSVESRVKDLHDAFLDKNVKGIFTVIGGYNCNQILDELDFNMIKENPKVLCGYSDITALGNAIFAKTGLITYSGPHYSTLGMKKGLDYTMDYFKKCLMEDYEFQIVASEKWSDEAWFLDQENRNYITNSGMKIFKDGNIDGRIVGGNLCTFNLLHGTEYMPSLDNSILFIEDDELSSAETFDRDLQSLIHQPEFSGVKGIVLGRFQKEMNMTPEVIEAILKSKKKLKDLPIVFDVDFGHTTPQITFPIGGTCSLNTDMGFVTLIIDEH